MHSTIQFIQSVDTEGKGVNVGFINKIRVLGYADDLAMLEDTVPEMTTRFTHFADEAKKQADMNVKLSKTFTQIVARQEKIWPATEAEIQQAEKKFPVKCEYAGAGCDVRFKTKRAMRIHLCSCRFEYGKTGKAFEVEKLLTVFGRENNAKNVPDKMGRTPR